MSSQILAVEDFRIFQPMSVREVPWVDEIKQFHGSWFTFVRAKVGASNFSLLWCNFQAAGKYRFAKLRYFTSSSGRCVIMKICNPDITQKHCCKIATITNEIYLQEIKSLISSINQGHPRWKHSWSIGHRRMILRKVRKKSRSLPTVFFKLITACCEYSSCDVVYPRISIERAISALNYFL